MNGTTMNKRDMQRKVSAIAKTLKGISTGDAVAILHKSWGLVLEKGGATSDLNHPATSRKQALNKRKCPSKIEGDPEVKAFIDELANYTNYKDYKTYTEMVRLCVKKFGAQRSPGKSAIGRYFSKQLKVSKDV